MTVFDSFSLEGKKALVLGTGPGIGSNVARGFAQAGADLVIAQRTRAKVEALAETIRAESPKRRVHPEACDASDSGQLDALIEFANERLGSLDIVFFNAYATAAAGTDAFRTAMLDASDEDWMACFQVNLLAPYRLARALAPGMQERGSGSFIFVLTTTAFRPLLPYIAYGSTKAGLGMMTRYLAKALAPSVRVNAICPGTISADGAMRDSFIEPIKKVPIGRLGLAREVVPAALFLASSASSYTTGQVLYVDGGRVNTVG